MGVEACGKLTKDDIDQLCELLAKLDKTRWDTVRGIVDNAFKIARQDAIERHADEFEHHGMSVEWFSDWISVVLEEDPRATYLARLATRGIR